MSGTKELLRKKKKAASGGRIEKKEGEGSGKDGESKRKNSPCSQRSFLPSRAPGATERWERILCHSGLQSDQT